MKNIIIVILLLFSNGLLAKADFTFATHTTPPLSDKVENLYRIIFQRMGYSIDFSNLPGKRIISLVNSGIIDGDATRIKSFTDILTDETNNYLLVDEPIIDIEIVIIVKKDFNLNPVNWATVNQGTAAYLTGSMNIESKVKYKNRVPVSNAGSAFEMVKRGRVHSAILFKTIAADVLEKNDYKQHLKIIPIPIETFSLYLFLNKKHTKLHANFIKNLQKLKRDGTYDAIIKKE